MCGICGILSPAGPPDDDLILRMITALRHRGPDGSGCYRDDTVTLGHARLSIIDVQGGAQPMTGEDERVWVTFNGEIFNYLELAEELRARGHVFRTRSDTEVIVHAWEQWGQDCFRRFNGQWAIALWDRGRRELVLSRDRYGIHPLFYARAGGRLLFASEVKSLFCDPEMRRELDPGGLDELLTFWAVMPPRTVFAGVAQVPPGCSVTFTTDGGEEVRRYWEASFPPRHREPSQDIERNAAALRESLIEATRLRFLRSDVPVGAYLSGGIDSAVTAAVIAEYAGSDVHTFSLRFADGDFDEGDHQRVMSERLGTPHREVVVDGADIAAAFPETIRHTESPVLRSAPAPMFLLSQLVRDEGYKVVVTGEGSDEVLAGYDIFREAKVRQFVARNPDSEVRARAIELLYPWMKRSPNLAPSFARSFFAQRSDVSDFAMSHRPRWHATSALKHLLNPEFLEASASDADGDLLAAMPAGADEWDPLSRAQWLEIATLLPGYLLSSQGDRMLMAHSVEGRFPFLDHEVFATAADFPARQKILGLDEKHLLKRAFADLVPESILRRPKQPYRAPDATSFFSGEPADWVADVTSPAAVQRSAVFRPVAVDRLLAKCRASDGATLSNTDDMRLMLVLSLQLLHRMFVTDWSPPPPRPPEPFVLIERSPAERHVR